MNASDKTSDSPRPSKANEVKVRWDGVLDVQSYAPYPQVRSLAHRLKVNDPDAINEAAEVMAGMVKDISRSTAGSVLVPIPNSTGRAVYTKALAEKIAERTGLQFIDALECKPHKQLYDKKSQSGNEGLRPMKFNVIGEIPEGKHVILVDNVLDTGTTAMSAFKQLKGNASLLVLGSTTNYKKYNYPIRVSISTERQPSEVSTIILGNKPINNMDQTEDRKRQEQILQEEQHSEEEKKRQEQEQQAEQQKKEQEKKKDKEAVTASRMLLQSTLLMTAIAMAKDSMGDKKVPQSRQGAWLNPGFKAAPSLLGTKMPISGFNAVMMSLHSDANGFKTNVYTTYENAKKEGMSVMGGQKGLPFNWYQYDSYVNKYNVNDVIDKTVFDQLSPQDKELFKVRQEKTMRSVHNIDQTIMPYESKEAYEKILAENGVSVTDKTEQQDKTDKQEEVPEEKSEDTLSPILRQFYDLKSKHPDAILLFRVGDFYETYSKDAEATAKTLGITLTRHNTQKDKDKRPLYMAGFPHHALDTYLPRLIRAGHRVAICDQLELPKQSKNQTKRSITEMVTPNGHPNQSAPVDPYEAKAREVNTKVEQLVKAMKDAGLKVVPSIYSHSTYHADTDIMEVLPEPKSYTNKGFGYLNKVSERANEILREAVAYTGTSERLNRASRANMLPESNERYERLVQEVTAGSLMLKMGLSAKISKNNLDNIDFWQRELKEDPKLLDRLERDVNNAIEVLDKISKGQQVDYAVIRGDSNMDTLQPRSYSIASELARLPDINTREVVVVRDSKTNSAAVILPKGASMDFDNELPGLSKQRIISALRREGVGDITFYNAGGALGLNQPNDFFKGKTAEVVKLRNWNLVTTSKIDMKAELARTVKPELKSVSLQKVPEGQHQGRYALVIRPVEGETVTILPEKNDVTRFFHAVKEGNSSEVKEELGQKYIAIAQQHPELRMGDVFMPKVADGVDLKRINRVSLVEDKNDKSKYMVAQIDGMSYRKKITAEQWSSMFYVDDKNEYKVRLAASLLGAEIRQVDNNRLQFEEQGDQVQAEAQNDASPRRGFHR